MQHLSHRFKHGPRRDGGHTRVVELTFRTTARYAIAVHGRNKDLQISAGVQVGGGRGAEECDHLFAQREAQVQAGLRQAKGELRAVAVDLAIQAAGKLLEKNLDEATQRQLVERHLADLERSGGSGARRR